MKYSLVIFDLDGTLVNSIRDLGNSVNITLRAMGLPEHDIESYKMMVGHGVRNLVRNASPEALKDDQQMQERLLSRFFEEYERHIADFTRPYPGMETLLRLLQDQGIKLAIASNKFQKGTEILAAKLFPDIRFGAVMGNCPGAPLKPDPAVVTTIIDRVNESPERCLMVGDSGTDIKTAEAAGIDCVAVSWGFRKGEELCKLCGRVVDSAEELQAAILG